MNIFKKLFLKKKNIEYQNQGTTASLNQIPINATLPASQNYVGYNAYSGSSGIVGYCGTAHWYNGSSGFRSNSDQRKFIRKRALNTILNSEDE